MGSSVSEGGLNRLNPRLLSQAFPGSSRFPRKYGGGFLNPVIHGCAPLPPIGAPPWGTKDLDRGNLRHTSRGVSDPRVLPRAPTRLRVRPRQLVGRTRPICVPSVAPAA